MLSQCCDLTGIEITTAAFNRTQGLSESIWNVLILGLSFGNSLVQLTNNRLTKCFTLTTSVEFTWLLLWNLIANRQCVSTSEITFDGRLKGVLLLCL